MEWEGSSRTPGPNFPIGWEDETEAEEGWKRHEVPKQSWNLGCGHSGRSAILPLEPGAGGVKQAAPALNTNLPTLGYLHALLKLPEDVSWSTQALTSPSKWERQAGIRV